MYITLFLIVVLPGVGGGSVELALVHKDEHGYWKRSPESLVPSNIGGELSRNNLKK